MNIKNIKIIKKTGGERIFKAPVFPKFKTEGELLAITIISNEFLHINQRNIPKNLRFYCKKIDEERVRNFLNATTDDNVLKIEEDNNLNFSFDENII